jgi:hypothetical protein
MSKNKNGGKFQDGHQTENRQKFLNLQDFQIQIIFIPNISMSLKLQ